MITTTEKPGNVLISFIIAYYNIDINLLRECLDSILALNLSADEREIILVDDGSDVSPMEGLHGYERHITYVQQENGGQSVARNTGIEKAHGEYIQFVDADDYLIVCAYDKIINELRKGDAYGGRHEVLIFNHLKSTSQKHRFHLPITVFWEAQSAAFMSQKNMFGVACGLVFRKDTLGDLRFTPGILHEDEEFVPLLLLRTNTVTYTRMAAYYYRQRSESIINSQSVEHVNKRFRDFSGVILRLRHVMISENKPVLSRRIHQLTMDYTYNAMRLSGSKQLFWQRMMPLYEYGLMPMPVKQYTIKYFVFSLVCQLKMGVGMLYSIFKKR